MQLVHVNEDGDYAIVVVLSDYGPTNWWTEAVSFDTFVLSSCVCFAPLPVVGI